MKLRPHGLRPAQKRLHGLRPAQRPRDDYPPALSRVCYLIKGLCLHTLRSVQVYSRNQIQVRSLRSGKKKANITITQPMTVTLTMTMLGPMKNL